MVEGKGIFKDYDPRVRKSINTGYIVIPENVDRDQFIEQCLRLKRFSIFVEGGGGIMHNCYITRSALREIHFPTKNQRLGSSIVFFADPFSGKIIITDVVERDDDTEIDKEEVAMFKKTKNGNYAILAVDGNGQITLDVIGTAKNGKVSINVRNSDFSGELNVHVKGSINVYSEGNTNIKAINGNVTIDTNQSVQLNVEEDVSIQSGKLIVNKGDEAMVRGNELQAQIEKTNKVVEAINDSLQNWIVVSQDGGEALQLYYKAQIAGKELGDFKDIKSEKSFLE